MKRLVLTALFSVSLFGAVLNTSSAQAAQNTAIKKMSYLNLNGGGEGGAGGCNKDGGGGGCKK